MSPAPSTGAAQCLSVSERVDIPGSQQVPITWTRSLLALTVQLWAGLGDGLLSSSHSQRIGNKTERNGLTREMFIGAQKIQTVV